MDEFQRLKAAIDRIYGGSSIEPIHKSLEIPWIAIHPSSLEKLKCAEITCKISDNNIKITTSRYLPCNRIFSMNDAGKELIEKMKIARLLED